MNAQQATRSAMKEFIGSDRGCTKQARKYDPGPEGGRRSNRLLRKGNRQRSFRRFIFASLKIPGFLQVNSEQPNPCLIAGNENVAGESKRVPMRSKRLRVATRRLCFQCSPAPACIE